VEQCVSVSGCEWGSKRIVWVMVEKG